MSRPLHPAAADSRAEWERDSETARQCDCCSVLLCLAGQLAKRQIKPARAAATLKLMAAHCQAKKAA